MINLKKRMKEKLKIALSILQIIILSLSLINKKYTKKLKNNVLNSLSHHIKNVFQFRKIHKIIWLLSISNN